MFEIYWEHTHLQESLSDVQHNVHMKLGLRGQNDTAPSRSPELLIHHGVCAPKVLYGSGAAVSLCGIAARKVMRISHNVRQDRNYYNPPPSTLQPQARASASRRRQFFYVSVPFAVAFFARTVAQSCRSRYNNLHGAKGLLHLAQACSKNSTLCFSATMESCPRHPFNVPSGSPTEQPNQNKRGYTNR